MWPTPDEYRISLGGEKLGDKIKVWRIQTTPRGFNSAVSWGDAFDDFPDAEVLTPGYNDGKPNGSVAVGRHGNFLQWGFSGAPSQMTDAGRAFFLNCICYIRRFDGKRPLVFKQVTGRTYAIYLAGASRRFRDPEFAGKIFADEILNRYKRDPDAVAAYFRENLEWIYWADVYRVDDQLKALGIESNRTAAALQKLVDMLDDPARAATARRLLARYTSESHQTRGQWQAWLDENRGRIFFSDCSGYRFHVVPKGYLEAAR